MATDPEIGGFLVGGNWCRRFDEERLAAGRRLQPKVRDLRSDEAEPGAPVLRATVAGETVELCLWREGGEWNLETTCSCGERLCAHAAAVLGEAARPRNVSRLGEGRVVRGGGTAALPVASHPTAGPDEGLPQLEARPSFRLDVAREPTASRVVHLLLQALKIPDSGNWVVARPVAVYGPHEVVLTGGPGPRELPVNTADGPALLRRDLGAELAAVMSLQQVGLTSLAAHAEFRFLLALAGKREGGQTADAGIWFPSPAHGRLAEYWPWLRATGAADLRAGGWEVRFLPGVGHEVLEPDPEGFRYVLEDDGSGWFHLSVGFEVGERRFDLLPILADLLDRGVLEETLEYPARGHILHHLPDGSALRLPVERVRRILRHFAALLDPRRFQGGKLKLHPLDAAALGASPDLAVETPPRLAELAARLRHFEGIEQVPAPAGLRADLRLYQLEGFRWMQFLARHELHGILADDMGLGKTLQTLAHLLAEKLAGRTGGRASLVVAPTSVVPNWRAEARKFAPELRVLALEGPHRGRYFRSIPHADLVLTSYALLQRDGDKLRGFPYHVLALDEAQNIKNPAAKVAQAACRLEARHRLCLSGTPVENHLGELWSLMRFLMPGFLGGQEDFNRRFRHPIERDGNEERQAALKLRVAPLILRRTKDQVAKELPPKTELVHLVELNTAQKDLYETVRATMDRRVRQAIAACGLEGSRMVFLEALLKLRQICCEPKLLKLDDQARREAAAAGSGKLDYLADLLDTLLEEGRRILLFSQFTSMLALIEDLLRARGVSYLMLTGASKDRGGLVERFQSGEVALFLISLKAGGTGLNLTAADTVIHYDPWWNPAAEAQATDRAYRIGQTQPVFVHKLICQGTVEERIHQLQAKKSLLANNLLAEAAGAAAPDEATLSQLLAPLG